MCCLLKLVLPSRRQITRSEAEIKCRETEEQKKIYNRHFSTNNKVLFIMLYFSFEYACIFIEIEHAIIAFRVK